MSLWSHPRAGEGQHNGDVQARFLVVAIGENTRAFGVPAREGRVAAFVCGDVRNEVDCKGKISGQMEELGDTTLIVNVIDDGEECFRGGRVVEWSQRAKKWARPSNAFGAFSTAHCDLCGGQAGQSELIRENRLTISARL